MNRRYQGVHSTFAQVVCKQLLNRNNSCHLCASTHSCLFHFDVKDLSKTQNRRRAVAPVSLKLSWWKLWRLQMCGVLWYPMPENSLLAARFIDIRHRHMLEAKHVHCVSWDHLQLTSISHSFCLVSVSHSWPIKSKPATTSNSSELKRWSPTAAMVQPLHLQTVKYFGNSAKLLSCQVAKHLESLKIPNSVTTRTKWLN
jgi:hypothetical protein